MSQGKQITDRALVDRIGYLASLASDKQAIDPMLDSLRAITARWTPPTPLTNSSRQQILQLEQKLKKYLSNSDPLRTFTLESLEERLQAQEAQKKSSIFLNTFGLALLSAVTAGALGFLILGEVPLGKRLLGAVPFFYATLCIGIAWLYLSSLRDFRKEFKRASVYMGIGAIFMASNAQYMFYSLWNIADAAPLRYAGIPGTVAIGVALFYIWLRVYARQLGIQSKLISYPLVLGICAAIAAVAFAVPHGTVQHELYFDISLASLWLMGAFLAFGFILSRKIMHQTTVAFAKPMKLLHIYFSIVLFPTLATGVLLMVQGELYGDLVSLMMLGAVMPQILLLYTGYLFKKGTR